MQPICTKYIEEISIKSNAKKWKISNTKNYSVLYHCKLLTNSLAIITQFLQMSIYEILKFLHQNMLHKKIN